MNVQIIAYNKTCCKKTLQPFLIWFFPILCWIHGKKWMCKILPKINMKRFMIMRYWQKPPQKHGHCSKQYRHKNGVCWALLKSIYSLPVSVKWGKGEALSLVLAEEPAVTQLYTVDLIPWTPAVVTHPLFWGGLALTATIQCQLILLLWVSIFAYFQF